MRIAVDLTSCWMSLRIAFRITRHPRKCSREHDAVNMKQ